MRCPECGCENEENYKFCKKCGAPRENNIKKIDPISNRGISSIPKSKKLGGPLSSKSILRNPIVIAILIIVIIAIVAIAVSSLEIGAIKPGNEGIININQKVYNSSSGDFVYQISFTLTNAPKEAKTYYAKATWYDSSGNVVLTKSDSLKFNSINDDNTMEVIIQATSPNKINNISKCTIEVTNNQGQSVTWADYSWLNN